MSFEFVWLWRFGTSVISTQDCFKASWSSHKSVHVKAKQSDGTGSAENEGWLYCMKNGKSRSPKLPYFEWTGYVSVIPPTLLLMLSMISGLDSWHSLSHGLEIYFSWLCVWHHVKCYKSHELISIWSFWSYLSCAGHWGHILYLVSVWYLLILIYLIGQLM